MNAIRPVFICLVLLGMGIPGMATAEPEPGFWGGLGGAF